MLGFEEEVLTAISTIPKDYQDLEERSIVSYTLSTKHHPPVPTVYYLLPNLNIHPQRQRTTAKNGTPISLPVSTSHTPNSAQQPLYFPALPPFPQ